MNTASQV